jgi:hypothetical protein
VNHWFSAKKLRKFSYTVRLNFPSHQMKTFRISPNNGQKMAADVFWNASLRNFQKWAAWSGEIISAAWCFGAMGREIESRTFQWVRSFYKKWKMSRCCLAANFFRVKFEYFLRFFHEMRSTSGLYCTFKSKRSEAMPLLVEGKKEFWNSFFLKSAHM